MSKPLLAVLFFLIRPQWMSKDMRSSQLCLIPLEISAVSSNSGTIEYQIFRRIRKNELTKRCLETEPIHIGCSVFFSCVSVEGLLRRLRKGPGICCELTAARRRVTNMVEGCLCRIFIAWKLVIWIGLITLP